MSKPPLELHAELTAADGTRYRWSGERTDPGERPQNVSFASKRFEGFERCTANLSRPVDRDYPDLGLYDSIALVGFDGSTAYEGRLGQVPRSTPFGIGVEATGWMAHARDVRCRPFYADADMSRWQSPPLSRQAQIASGGFSQGKITSSSSAAGLVWNPPAESLPLNEHSELHYVAPPGCRVARVGYRGKRDGSWTNFEAAQLFTDDVNTFSTTPGTAALTLNDTIQYADVSAPERYAMLRALVSTAHTPLAAVQQSYSRMVVYGTDSLNLTSRDIDGEPDGFYVSDMVRDVCSRFTPRLDPSGVQGTTWPVPHAAWLDRTNPYDVWLDLNRYHLWELAVWEDRTLHYGPSDLTDYDWEVRTTDPGVNVRFAGPDTVNLANYAVVQFTNVRTGEVDEVSPDTHPELRDESVESPANRHGIPVELEVTLTDPTDPDTAAQIGRVRLAENNQPKQIAMIEFQGHIRDRAGHWQQGWKMRAGDTVAITNWPNNRARLIVESEWNHDTKTGTFSTDSTFQRIDAFLDRNNTALRAAGLVG